MEKLKMETKDLVQENIEKLIEKLAEIFPGVITEARDEKGNLLKAVDFELLKQELSDRVVEGDRERYQLTWPGKKEAMLLANMPINKTLRPVKKESVDWETTGNIYIEGDNLEALKILQESYLNKIKCIYIDPPYNTGKDFIYRDNFKQSREEYLADSGQVDGDGNRLFQNTESNGRFHSDWLSMMYPRLKLARNLLREDGVILISIDDNEVHNLRKICDEIFGERNFIGSITIQSNPRGRQSDTYLASVHDYLVCYAKNSSETKINGAPLTEEQKKEFKYKESNGEPYRLLGLRQRGSASKREDRPDMFFPIYVNEETQEISLADYGFGWVPVYPRKSDGTDGRWMWGKEKVTSEIHLLVPKLINRRGEYDIFVKDYLNRGESERTRKYKTIWDSKLFNNQAGTQEVKKLLNSDAMPFPKPKALIKEICRLGSGNDDIILDFFSGSATTAHAVMQLNAEDGGNRKYIMVQLPEPCDEKSKAYKAGFKNISEIGKERIRRAAKKIKEETGTDIDYGFRVFKVDSSNMKDVYYRPEELYQQDLFGMIYNIKEDRTGEDLLIQVMLEWGLELSLPMEKRNILGKEVHFVAGNSLVACFDEDVSEELVREIAGEEPLRVVFRDSSFAGDAARINVEELFKMLSPTTEIKVI